MSSHLEVAGLGVGSLDRPMPWRRARVALDHRRHKVVADGLLHAALIRTLRAFGRPLLSATCKDFQNEARQFASLNVVAKSQVNRSCAGRSADPEGVLHVGHDPGPGPGAAVVLAAVGAAEVQRLHRARAVVAVVRLCVPICPRQPLVSASGQQSCGCVHVG